jgi:penicillin-binding protein 2
VPRLSAKLYSRYAEDPAKPLLNRASGGAYAPGSTFKPITALAGLKSGFPELVRHECTGVFVFGGMHLRCARRWGHGPLDMRHAIRESCNPYFCSLAADIGTNAVISAARAFGLGEKTGIDLGVDMAGTVPDGEWKMRMYGERWYPGDLPQMAIGQGMLLASPLQMARVAGAIGTGYLVAPRLKLDIPVRREPLPFSKKQLDVVREGMRMVVDGGTGRRGGERVAAAVSGKTGTAEIGRGETRRKNAWFIAFAPSEAPSAAVAMIIENGESGGGTAAPRVRNVLAAMFGETGTKEAAKR